MEFGEMKR